MAETEPKPIIKDIFDYIMNYRKFSFAELKHTLKKNETNFHKIVFNKTLVERINPRTTLGTNAGM